MEVCLMQTQKSVLALLVSLWIIKSAIPAKKIALNAARKHAKNAR